METLEPRELLLYGALAIGLVFGIVGRLSGFCLRSAVIEVVDGNAGRQAIAWVTALAVAITATQILVIYEIVDVTQSIYLSPAIAVVAIALGGLLFGFGMVLTRGCGGRHMVLAAGGNMRSWVVLLILGLTAYATLRGVLALGRVWIENVGRVAVDAETSSFATVVATMGGVELTTATILIVGLFLMAAFIVIGKIAVSVGAWNALLGVFNGVLIGLLIPAGWYVTGILGFDEFDPVRVESVTFTAPVGNAIQYLMTFTGSQADFGITVIGGALAGAFLAACLSRSFKAEGFDTPGHLARYGLGAMLMGFGGVLALGCTIGAGLSGVSTLSIGSVIALASIVLGSAVGHRIKVGIIGGRAPETVPAE